MHGKRSIAIGLHIESPAAQIVLCRYVEVAAIEGTSFREELCVRARMQQKYVDD
jgi:hypothetical protein